MTLAAVASAQAQSLPSHEIIVVVDHNPELYASFSTAMPTVTLTENRNAPGLSGSRNTGISLAQGDIVAFLDDDAKADPDWLKFLAEWYPNPEILGVGGLIVPSWENTRPAWFPEEFDWVVGCTYQGAPTSPTAVRNMLGANMSFRREVFASQEGFSNGIGRVAGKHPLGCEETEFCVRLAQRNPGSLLLFDNRAVVYHSVNVARCRLSYFRSRCFAEGISKSLVTAKVGTTDGLSTERRYITSTLPQGVMRGFRDLLRGDMWGLARSLAIVAGFTITLGGYVVGRLSP